MSRVNPSIPAELTADGLIYVFSFDGSHRDTLFATSLPLLTLSGAEVDVQLPAEWVARDVNRSILVHSQDRLIGWQTHTRGFALWSVVADLPDASLTDIIEMDGGVLAQYELSPVESEPRMTVWQGNFFDLFSFSFHDFVDAIDHVASFGLVETDAGVTLDLSNWWIDQEELLAPVATIDDLHGQSLRLEVRSLERNSHERPSVPGDRGRLGEFYLLGQTILDGVLCVSETALLTLTPADEGLILFGESEGILLETVGATWIDGGRQRGTAIDQVV